MHFWRLSLRISRRDKIRKFEVILQKLAVNKPMINGVETKKCSMAWTHVEDGQE